MKSRLMRSSMAALLLATVFFLVSKLAVAQNARPAGSPSCVGCSVDGKTTPRLPDGHPDLNGFWNNMNGVGNHIVERADDGSVLFDFAGEGLTADGGTSTSTPSEPNKYGSQNYNSLSEPPYKPEYAAKVKALVDTEQYGSALNEDPQMDCKPLGIPRGAVGAMQIIQTPQVVGILYENAPGPTYRIIYTDGRPHPKDLDTSFWGHSIGHWDGDTLVVDVVALNDETWFGGGMGGPKYALWHSDKEHVTERWTRNGDVLNYEATVEDPVVLSKPWVVTPKRMQHAQADDEIVEALCAVHDKGHFVKPTKEDPFICDFCSPDLQNGVSLGGKTK
jgi:hypothetical protein